MKDPHQVVITGVGLISAAGEGADANFDCLSGDPGQWPKADTSLFAPYPVHPMVELDLSRQIPRRSDQRQMGPWQRYGVYAAGLALDDAGVTGDEELLSRTNLIVAAGGGERDPEADAAVMAAVRSSNDQERALNEALAINLRPTLFLAQLSNLMAGNISIVHHVTGSSRTFMGEELSGAMALDVAARRIQSGQGDLFLVGSAYNGERIDMLLLLEFDRSAWYGDPESSVWSRANRGGILSGSMGAFLVLESAEHARARGAKVYARIDRIATDSLQRTDAGAWEAGLDRLVADAGLGDQDAEFGWMSGATGLNPATGAEASLIERNFGSRSLPVRAFGSRLGHGVEAQMPVGVSLAAVALSKQSYYPPFSEDALEQVADRPPETIAVTSIGHRRGEAIIVVAAA